MLNDDIKNILESSKETGWVLEPDAKRIMRIAGLEVPGFVHAKDFGQAEEFASKQGFPLVAKVVSPDILHKSDMGGVVVGIQTIEGLREAFDRLSGLPGSLGAVVEEMASGVELIVGAKNDAQFGPIILVGIGGVSVELYKDTAIRMAPIERADVPGMLEDLRAKEILRGFRGAPAVDLSRLSETIASFSSLVMDMEPWIESIDLNPVMCSKERCVVADARIILKQDR